MGWDEYIRFTHTHTHIYIYIQESLINQNLQKVINDGPHHSEKVSYILSV